MAENTQDAVALRFSEQYGDKLRYVAEWGRWLAYTGKLWCEDRTLGVFDLARHICRQIRNESNDRSEAKDLGSAAAVAAVERLAKADRRHAATVDQWDADPWLLNTPAGVVDLRTGKMREHRAADYMTKMTAVSPSGDCPQWRKFLFDVMGGDAELVAFLRKIVGYALTGATTEHALVFLYGTGGNGKSVFVNSVTGILASYAAVAPMETFTEAKNERHPTDMAMLRGARLVTAQETEEGRRWAESRVKAMTGGDPITAQFMRQDFFTFNPQFKLMFAGNHKPSLRNVDAAMQRRFNMVPFNKKIPKEEQDPLLLEKLKDEWAGILQWAIEGCLQWQKVGLAPPEVIQDATTEYFSVQDSVAIWLDERCKLGSGYETSENLFFAWKVYAEAVGEYPGSQKRLSQKLRDLGLEAKREAGTGKSGFEGISLRRR